MAHREDRKDRQEEETRDERMKRKYGFQNPITKIERRNWMQYKNGTNKNRKDENKELLRFCFEMTFLCDIDWSSIDLDSYMKLRFSRSYETSYVWITPIWPNNRAGKFGRSRRKILWQQPFSSFDKGKKDQRKNENKTNPAITFVTEDLKEQR